jgi:thymidylate synthase
MFEERDLGPIYGYQWRNYNGKYESHDTCSLDKGVDQIKTVVEVLKKNPHDRRMIVNAWNPLMLTEMGLPPCHYAFQITVINGKLNLLWNQRSVDVMLGLPFNIASYALLLHLFAKESGFAEGKLIGFLADTHIYVNHIDGAKEQLSRDPNLYPLPTIQTDNFTSIFDWKYEDSKILNYQSYPTIKFEIAV